MTPLLPDTEHVALDLLDGQGDFSGNWAPGAVVPIAFACIRNGLNENDFADLILSSDLGRLLEERSEFNRKPGKLRSFLAARWSWAEDEYQGPTGGNIQERARKLLGRVFLARWPKGQNGITQRMVALALVRVAVERGAYSFDCSARWLATIAGISDPAKASRARKALAETGLISVSGEGRTLRRVRLNLDWSDGYNYKQNSAVYLFVVDSDCAGLNHDLFVRSGLGPVAGWVLTVLEAVGEPVTLTGLAEVLGVGKTSVRDAATKLEAHGLAAMSGGAVKATGTGELDAVADSLGVLGWRENLATAFAVEQAANRQERADWYADQVREQITQQDEWDRIHQELGREFAEFVRQYCKGEEVAIPEWLAPPAIPDSDWLRFNTRKSDPVRDPFENAPTNEEFSNSAPRAD